VRGISAGTHKAMLLRSAELLERADDPTAERFEFEVLQVVWCTNEMISERNMRWLTRGKVLAERSRDMKVEVRSFAHSVNQSWPSSALSGDGWKSVGRASFSHWADRLAYSPTFQLNQSPNACITK